MHSNLLFAAMLTLVMAAGVPASADEETLEFSSGARRVDLLELYTSEGCSSCPPADQWLSRLREDPYLWRRFTPVAFHVDYWDYIGWKDRFASSRNGDRQRQYAREGGTRVVYTPGFFRNGREWRGWRAGGTPAGGDTDVGDLRLRVSDGKADIRFEPRSGITESLTAHVAVLGMNLETTVKAGENKGRVLRHDFVVLGRSSSPLASDAGRLRATVTLPRTTGNGDRAVVAWVSRAGAQAPLQSVGGYLNGDSGGGL